MHSSLPVDMLREGGLTCGHKNNTLEHPTGPEYQLVVGEGTYVLKDDLHLATPPPHPSDAPQPNNNPLATTMEPPKTGTKPSIVTLSQRRPLSQGLFRVATAQSARSNPPIAEEPTSPKSDAGSQINGFGSAGYYNHSSGYGDNNPALQAAPVKGSKKDTKLKPKNNIIKSNSQYISRVIPHEALQKRLAEHSADGMFAFANVNRAFVWLDLSSEMKVENMTKVLFTKAHVLSHDVNQATKSSGHLDIVMGFNTSDIIWYEPMSQKYARINKNGAIRGGAVQSILWVPGKEHLFLAAFADGTLIAFDKDKEDAPFTPEESTPVQNGDAAVNGNGTTTNGTTQPQNAFKVLKSINSRDQKSNPVAAYKVSNLKINMMAFSPDGSMLALVCEDGTLTILDYVKEKVLDVYRSYYGAMLCVTWSPDGRYVLTGGQDDLVSIWSLQERMLVARCVGHESWVLDVKFDFWRCDERNYRFGSVGEDCRLLLWDFSVGMLRRPKAPRNRASASISASAGGRKESMTTVGRLRSNSSRSVTQVQSQLSDGTDGLVGGEEEEEEVEVVHAVDSKAQTAALPPVMSKSVDKHPLCWLGFEEGGILTSCKDGESRPCFALPCFFGIGRWMDVC